MSPKGKVPPQLKEWLAVVSSVKNANKTMKYKDILKKAKAIYHKDKKSLGI